MSRTYRNKSRAHIGKKERWDGTTHDGVYTRASSSCENHGDCPVCEGDRLHSTKKRMGLSIEEQISNEERANDMEDAEVWIDLLMDEY